MRTSLFVALTAIFLSQAALARSAPTEPTPKGNPGEWAASEDYPASALREDIEGVTGFRLTVDQDGRPAECTVTRRSGSEALDETTCQLLMERATFQPATDKRGKVVPGTWSSSVRWKIPSGSQPLPPAGSTEVTFVVDAEGNVSDCKAVVAQIPATQRDACAELSGGQFTPSLDANGQPQKVRVRWLSRVEHEPATD